MYNKTIIRFGFCDIQNNQGLGKDNPYLDLDYSGYHRNLIKPLYMCRFTRSQVFFKCNIESGCQSKAVIRQGAATKDLIYIKIFKQEAVIWFCEETLVEKPVDSI